MPTRLILLFALLTLPATALEWKTKSLTATTAPFQRTQDAVFEFKNTGPQPVKILDLETSCDCLEATAAETVYAPGATGTIKARFTVGDRLGVYDRYVTVVTDEGPEPVRLHLEIEVPDIVVLTPRSLDWKIGEAAREKIVELQVVPGLEITFSQVQTTSGVFAARLETVEAGRHYRVYLKPPDTTLPASAAIRIFGRAVSGESIVVSAYGNVE